MLDDRIIRQATEEALSELQHSAPRFEIEPVPGAAHGDTRQIRLFDSDGNDKATVIDFQDKNGKVSFYFDEIKQKIMQRLETLIEISK